MRFLPSSGAGSSPLCRVLALALVAGAAPASAVDFGIKLEGGAAIPVSAPQSSLFHPGGGVQVKALFGLTSFLDIGPSVQFMMLSPAIAHAEPGGLWGFGGGVRLKRPHDAVGAWGLSPWVDGDVLYILTGDLSRPGLDVAAGVSIPLGAARTFWVSPFVRYLHVFQLPRAGFDNRDANVLTVGLSLEVGTGVKQPPEVRYVDREQVRTVEKEISNCPDTDADGVVDTADLCPAVKGPVTNSGCPEYRQLVVKKDKLELKEKLFFEWDQATLMAASMPVLDEVAQALQDNRGFSVQVEGHTDSTGADDHNQTLSEARAQAVLDYLVSKGVAKSRLTSVGFSSSVPLATNTTAGGREKNRRVEFVVHFLILKPRSTP